MHSPDTPRPWLLVVAVVLAVFGIVTLPRLRRPVAPPDPTPVVTIPQAALPTPNAFDYDVKAGKTLVDRDKIFDALYSRTVPAYTLAQKEQLVRENAEALRLVRAGFKFPFVSEQQRGEDSNIAYYARFDTVSRLFKLDGNVKEEHGDWGGAADSDLDAVRFGEDLPHGATETGLIFGIVCQAIGRKPIWALIPHLTAPQARSAARRLEAIEARHTPLVSVMREEEWTGQARLLAIFHRPDWRQALIDDDIRDFGITGTSSHELNSILGMGLHQATKRSEFDTYTRYREEFVNSARAPYAAHVPIKHVMLDITDVLAYYALHHDPYQSQQFRDTSSQAQNALLMTTLALRAYRLDHGRLPNTLHSLAPNYLSKIPADPFALSGPLRYRLTGDRYVLYSIGPDGRDDHGTAISDWNRPLPIGSNETWSDRMEKSRGDIVAGVNID